MFLLVANLLGCAPQPYYYRGINLLSIEFELVSDEHGIYPNSEILGHETNPFPDPLFDGKWDIESFGHAPASYYAWASQIAVEPTGENQFYTAMALTNLYQFEMVDDYERYYVWKMAVQAHESVLINFPNSISYLADEISSFSLAPLSYEALGNLGSDRSNWIEITLDDGSVAIVPKEDL